MGEPNWSKSDFPGEQENLRALDLHPVSLNQIYRNLILKSVSLQITLLFTTLDYMGKFDLRLVFNKCCRLPNFDDKPAKKYIRLN